MKSFYNTNLKITYCFSFLFFTSISFSVFAQTNNSPAPIQKTNGVWLKGDLHVHSRHSTESSNNPIKKILAFSQSVGIDFLCITDHDNHVKGDVANHTWVDKEFKSDSIILLYGAEWTTTRGHGNVFSAKPYNHQKLYDIRDDRDVNIGKVKKSLGVHLSANHPIGKDNFGFSYDLVNSIEVWNSAIWPKNANSIMIWDDMLSSGRMLTGRGGSDSHHGVPDSTEKASKNSYEANFNYVGTPTTWVFAKDRTREAVVEALNKGKVSISSNPLAPRVEFYADVEQNGKFDMMMGDNSVSTYKPVKFQVQLIGNSLPNEEYTVTVIKNGGKFNTYKVKGEIPMVGFTDTPNEKGRTYYRVIVEGTNTQFPQVPGSAGLSENMIAISNPIYFNFDPKF